MHLTARFKNLVAFANADGGAVALHAENLQIARIDADALRAILCPEPTDAREEIERWNAELDDAAHDGIDPMDIDYLSINVAQICNLKCTYCAAGGDGTFGEPLKSIDLEKAYVQLERILTPLPSGARFTLNFLGGEPLIAPRAIEAMITRAKLLTAGRKINLVYKITTNATLIGPRAAEMLAKHNFHVQVSLDGPPEINDVSRPFASGRGSTEAAMRGVTELFDRREQLGSISVNAVHGVHNVDVCASYEWLRHYDWDRISLSFNGEAKDETLSTRYAQSLTAAAEAAWAYGGEAKLRRIHEFNTLFHTFDSQRRNRNFCGAGKSQLLLDAKARTYACYWWAGSKKDELTAGSREERDTKHGEAHVDRHGCGDCWARNVCGGGCMHLNKVRNGDSRIRDENFCQRTKTIIAKGVELYERARSSNGNGNASEVR